MLYDKAAASSALVVAHTSVAHIRMPEDCRAGKVAPADQIAKLTGETGADEFGAHERLTIQGDNASALHGALDLKGRGMMGISPEG